MEGFKRVVAVENEGDWYVIPVELQDDFNNLAAEIEEASLCDLDEDDSYYDLADKFNEKFGQYATGGDLNLVELYTKENA